MQFVEKMSNSTNVLREKNVAWQLQRLVRFLQEWLVICISWTFQDYFCFSCDVSSEINSFQEMGRVSVTRQKSMDVHFEWNC